MFKKIDKFLDKLEDKIRAALSRRPILYAMIGGVAVVLFWRGVWITADSIPFINNGPVSIIVSVLILLGTGLFVSFFIGDRIFLSGMKKEKKIFEKTETEIELEGDLLNKMNTKLDKLEKEVHELGEKK